MLELYVNRSHTDTANMQKRILTQSLGMKFVTSVYQGLFVK